MATSHLNKVTLNQILKVNVWVIDMRLFLLNKFHFLEMSSLKNEQTDKLCPQYIRICFPLLFREVFHKWYRKQLFITNLCNCKVINSLNILKLFDCSLSVRLCLSHFIISAIDIIVVTATKHFKYLKENFEVVVFVNVTAANYAINVEASNGEVRNDKNKFLENMKKV